MKRTIAALVAAALLMSGCGGGLGTALEALLRIQHAATLISYVDVYILRNTGGGFEDLATVLPVKTRLAPGETVDDISLPPGEYMLVFTETNTLTQVAETPLTVSEEVETEAVLTESNGTPDIVVDVAATR